MYQVILILERYGADTGLVHLNPAATPSTSANPATTSEGAQRLELLKEVLRVNKQRVQTGEVTLRKEVITETQTVEVPLMHEELVIERRPVTNPQAVTGEIGSGEEIRVQLSEERVTVEKQPVVREEVIIEEQFYNALVLNTSFIFSATIRSHLTTLVAHIWFHICNLRF
jgi:uncharacterized protein (TIGR02271 family)